MTTAKSKAKTVKNSTKAKAASINDELAAKEKLHQASKLAGEASLDMVEEVKHLAESEYHERIDQVSELADRAESFVKEKPLLAISGALLTGWVASKTLGK